MIDDNTWDMLLGKSGRVPGTVGDEIREIAKSQGREFFDGNPQDLYPDELEAAKAEMKENDWDTGPDDEELFEYAMHPEQYRAYKSGAAKKTFDADLKKRKEEKAAPVPVAESSVVPVPAYPSSMNIEINGEKYEVKVSYDNLAQASKPPTEQESSQPAEASSNGTIEIIAPIEGNFMLTKNSSETPVKVGDQIKEGDIIGYIEAMKVYNAIHSDKSGTITEVVGNDGGHVDEDDLLIKLS